jgi:EAL domain-containing protein (putative c-di-GMP-specific phosphodiesterase class I)
MDIEINLDINIAYSDTTPLFQTTMMAMEKARNSPNNEIMKYSNTMNDSTVSAQNILMLKIVKRAIKQDLVVPYYQALIDNKTGKVYKYEALVRIKDINGRIIAPIEFLTISKRVKLYPAITKIVVEKSFETFKDRPEMFSVNLSYGDISNSETMEFFRGVLKANPETAKRLTIEILETEDIQDYANLLAFYRDIQKYGCKLAIDDFGAGYSNVMHVLMLKPDYIKIDGSLIKDILASDENQTFVKSIISFSKKYGIETVAEFVATKELAEYVSEIGIDISQGYHYAQPVEILPEADIAK